VKYIAAMIVHSSSNLFNDRVLLRLVLPNEEEQREEEEEEEEEE
jgi:hypothetical protein